MTAATDSNPDIATLEIADGEENRRFHQHVAEEKERSKSPDLRLDISSVGENAAAVSFRESKAACTDNYTAGGAPAPSSSSFSSSSSSPSGSKQSKDIREDAIDAQSDDSCNPSSSSQSTTSSRFTGGVARPHHLPKVDSLSKRMDEIRRTMAQEVHLNLFPCTSLHCCFCLFIYFVKKRYLITGW